MKKCVKRISAAILTAAVALSTMTVTLSAGAVSRNTIIDHVDSVPVQNFKVCYIRDCGIASSSSDRYTMDVSLAFKLFPWLRDYCSSKGNVVKFCLTNGSSITMGSIADLRDSASRNAMVASIEKQNYVTVLHAPRELMVLRPEFQVTCFESSYDTDQYVPSASGVIIINAPKKGSEYYPHYRSK